MVMESGGKARASWLGELKCRFKRVVARWNEIQWQDSLEAVAREVNLSKTEFDALMRSSSEEPLSLSLRLSHAGLSEDELAVNHADVLRDLRRVCARCVSRARCARDLKHERRATPEKYCPNEQTLRALAREARQSVARILPFPPRLN